MRLSEQDQRHRVFDKTRHSIEPETKKGLYNLHLVGFWPCSSLFGLKSDKYLLINSNSKVRT